MVTEARLGRPITSHDVARRAGVSRSTVSNILNGNDARFPESTRRKVLTAASELDYHPSHAGRSLKSGRSDTIVVLLPNTTFGSNLQDAVDQVVETTGPIGGNVVVRFAGRTAKATIDAVLSLRPLALVDLGVLSAEDRAYLEDRGTMITPRRRLARSPDGGVAEVQARALLAQGPRTLWFGALADERDDLYGTLRWQALVEHCRAKDLTKPRRIDVHLDVASGVEAVSEITSRGVPAGVACYNDDVALALLAGAARLSVDVPDSLSLIGVDNTRVGQLWSPRLTTIDTSFRELVLGISEDLRARLEGREVRVVSTPRFTLVPGDTT